MQTPDLILASASPRRQELLAQLGIYCTVVVAGIPEQHLAGETPEAYVQRIAAEKSLAVQSLSENQLPVLAADTEVVLDGQIFGKPGNQSHAVEMLGRLSGREHTVLSAVSLRQGGQHWNALSVSTVRFRIITADEMAAYWLTGEPCDKAGAYAIQGLGAVFVERLMGSFSGVMGLPLHETAELLGRINLAPLGRSQR
ncbi:MAG: septum formation inhibitor Maf [Methylococcus sp.]|nr:MAG: septum formation inhibitor Maf [Methylococcus sp.]